MKLAMVKTTDGSVFKFENPEFFDSIPEHKIIAVVTAKNEKICFPLYNVISFSVEGNDETK